MIYQEYTRKQSTFNSKQTIEHKTNALGVCRRERENNSLELSSFNSVKDAKHVTVILVPPLELRDQAKRLDFCWRMDTQTMNGQYFYREITFSDKATISINGTVSSQLVSLQDSALNNPKKPRAVQGLSPCLAGGGGLLKGINFVDCVDIFLNELETHGPVLIGKMGAEADENTTEHLWKSTILTTR
ncbi:succinate--CoA ligase [ADP-forming] subunit alpha-like [Euwallacea fornicatus]|uniref:succinate--CoA ligase [ADP-forming] subunit alpha-like n=1 Tax=Euwallacea fornicatus TaxID=995702 RepID=UPI0033905B26